MALAQKGISKAEYLIILAVAALAVTALMFLPAPQSGSSTGEVATGANVVYKNPVNTPSTSSNNALTNQPTGPNTGPTSQPPGPNNPEPEKCGTEFTRKWDSKTRTYKVEQKDYGGCEDLCDGCDYSHGYWGYCEDRVSCDGVCCGSGECCVIGFWAVKDASVVCDSAPTGAVVTSENVLTVGGGSPCLLSWEPVQRQDPTDHHYILFRTQAMKDSGELPVQYMQDGRVLRTEGSDYSLETTELPTCGPLYWSVKTTSRPLCGFTSAYWEDKDPLTLGCPNDMLPTREGDTFILTPPTVYQPHSFEIGSTVKDNGEVAMEFNVNSLGVYQVEFSESLCPADWQVIYCELISAPWPGGTVSFTYTGPKTGFIRTKWVYYKSIIPGAPGQPVCID
jgi:hypothetical protein